MNIFEKIKEINQAKQDMEKSILEHDNAEMRYNEALKNSQDREEYLNSKMEYDRIYNVYKYDQPYYRNYFRDQSKILLLIASCEIKIKTKAILIFCFCVLTLVVVEPFITFAIGIDGLEVINIIWPYVFIVWLVLLMYLMISTVGMKEVEKGKLEELAKAQKLK